MMSAHRPVPQPTPSRRAPFRFAAAALCAAFVLMAASGCTPMRKQGAVPTFPASTMNDAVEAYQKGDCRESIRRFSAALQQQEHPALLNGLGMAYLSCNQPRNAAQAFERAVSISPGSAALHTNAGTALYAANDYKRTGEGPPAAFAGQRHGRGVSRSALQQGARHVSDGAHGRCGHGSRHLCP